MLQSADASLTEPGGSIALTNASTWVISALLGSTALAIAVLAVASLGIMLIFGKLEVRRGAAVAFGLFILFGSAQIAAGLMGMGSGGRGIVASSPGNPVQQPLENAPPTRPYDPYAGASFAPDK